MRFWGELVQSDWAEEGNSFLDSLSLLMCMLVQNLFSDI